MGSIIIKKFFAAVDHKTLYKLLSRKINDDNFLWLMEEIINSFKSEYTKDQSFPKGMPIGNLTSQFFANIYLDPFDRFMKHDLKVKYYIRYADDFIILSESRGYLEALLVQIREFLGQKLKMLLHPDKVSIRDYYLGIDFLGYVIFPNFILPRTKTKRRMFRKIYKKIELFKANKIPFESLNQALQSYFGYLSHANTFKLTQQLKNRILFLLYD